MGEKRRAEEKLRTQIDGSQKTLQRAIGAEVYSGIWPMVVALSCYCRVMSDCHRFHVMTCLNAIIVWMSCDSQVELLSLRRETVLRPGEQRLQEIDQIW